MRPSRPVITLGILLRDGAELLQDARCSNTPARTGAAAAAALLGARRRARADACSSARVGMDVVRAGERAPARRS